MTATTSIPTTTDTSGFVDARGPRFTAALTSLVIAVTLGLLVSDYIIAGTVLLTWQTIAFAFGSIRVTGNPYARLWRATIRPRLTSPSTWETADSLTFAQRVGLAFTSVALGSVFAGLPVVALAATGAALFAATLNAVFGLCLGCKMYPAARAIRQTFGRVALPGR